MPTKDVKCSIRRNMIWRETKKYLGHYRIKFHPESEEYGKKTGKLVEMYRKIDFLIENEGFYISKREYIQKIKDLEKE